MVPSRSKERNTMSTPQILSTWAENISSSPTLAVDAKAKSLKAQNLDVCGFGAGEPDFDTPDFIKEACIRALSDGHTKYSPVSGILPLREALAQKYLSYNGISGVEAENVVVSPGGKFSCYLSILATCSPGDEVIIPAPYWVSYPEMVKLAGAVPKILKTSEASGFKISVEELNALYSSSVKMLILNSPSNPTGMVYNKAELEAILEWAMAKGIYILSDEIYEYLLYDGLEHVSLTSLNEEAMSTVLTVGGFSKSFSMTGWRLGTLLAPIHVAKAVTKLQSQMTSNPTTFAQYGALAALEQKEEAQKAINQMKSVFDRRRKKMLEAFEGMPGVSCLKSQGAFYLFPNISSFGLSSMDFCGRLLEDQLVAGVPGIAFGEDSGMRLSYATSDEVIEKGLSRMKTFCESLSGSKV